MAALGLLAVIIVQSAYASQTARKPEILDFVAVNQEDEECSFALEVTAPISKLHEAIDE